MKKKIIALIIFIILIFLGGLFLWVKKIPYELKEKGISNSFNPFGNFNSDSETSDTSDLDFYDKDSFFIPQDIPSRVPFIKISEAPVASAVFIQIGTGTSTEHILRYVERETGHIFDYSITLGTKKRVSNTTIPRIREAIWGNNGLSVALRYVENDIVKTFLGYLPEPKTSYSETSSLSGRFLPDNITTITIHPELDKVFYIIPTETGSVWYLTNSNFSNKVVFSHPFLEWNSQWIDSSSVMLTTKPSYEVPGGIFIFNSENGSLENIFTRISAPITKADLNSSYFVCSPSNSDGTYTSLYNLDNKQWYTLSFTALSDKCVWSKNTTLYCGASNYPTNINFPDAWYQGLFSFSDEVWGVDPETGISAPIIETKDIVPDGIDIESLIVSSDESFLTFINKQNGELWLADLSFTTSVQDFKNLY